MASETPNLNLLGRSASLGASQSKLVVASTKKPKILENTSSMASNTALLNLLGRSYSLGVSPSELVEASTVSELTQETVARDTIGTRECNEETPQVSFVNKANPPS
ncbi:hypothetical protein AALP_AA7G019800 [Arabis alpina]|uniref:Uncharacterized protein n=1 Tax=Arabis alpina TaxID=50452 RepID=A0A087GFF5_ARAAL|nr:hypothetical protein AALP_AA7G019800 [Arabis alpina]